MARKNSRNDLFEELTWETSETGPEAPSFPGEGATIATATCKGWSERPVAD